MIHLVKNGEIINTRKVCHHLGAPLQVDILDRERFEWAWDHIQKKLKAWEFVLIPFASWLKVIKSYMMMLIAFNLLVLKIAKYH